MSNVEILDDAVNYVLTVGRDLELSSTSEPTAPTTSSKNTISLLTLFAGVRVPDPPVSASQSVRAPGFSGLPVLLEPEASLPRISSSHSLILEGKVPHPVRVIGAVPWRTRVARFASGSSGEGENNLPITGFLLPAAMEF
jgi:hypothetical protein